jgi:hypothetical protein
VLFAARSGESDGAAGQGIFAQRLSTGKRTALVEGGAEPRHVSTGHRVDAVGNVLMGVAFDADRLAVGGKPAALVQGLRRPGSYGNHGLGDDGTPVYALGGSTGASDRYVLALSDRAGEVTPLKVPPGT